MRTNWMGVAATAALAMTGCIEDAGDETALLGEEAQGSFVTIGTTFSGGTKLVYDDVTGITGADLQNLLGITACDDKVLYAVENVGSGPTATRWVTFSKDGGQSWRRQALASSAEVACDHAQLLNLDSTGHVKAAVLRADGTMGAWTSVSTPTTFDRLNGGDGTFYAVKNVSVGKDIYIASAKSIKATLSFTKIANFGGSQVTGVGTNVTGYDNYNVGNTPAWPRRAFGVESNGTMITAPDLIAGTNTWTTVYTGNERYTALTAGSPNVLYGLQSKSGVKHLQRITISEDNCDDGVDNDRNGLKDGEDEACEARVGQAYCDAHGPGSYCADRYLPSSFLTAGTQNPRMLLCTSSGPGYVLRGVCKRNANSAITNDDALQSTNALRPPDPPNTARYCNMHWPDGTWRLRWGISDPCGNLTAQRPGGTIVRAGLYSTTGANTVHAFCTDGWWGPAGSAGDAPIYAVYNSAYASNPGGANRCTFVISMTKLPLFDRFFQPYHQAQNTNARPFIHNATAVNLAQFQPGAQGQGFVDRFGNKIVETSMEPAYDHYISEGRPLYAAADGLVFPDGARFRDVSRFGCDGSSNQGEVYVKYSVGTDPTYAETFGVYYAHLRKLLVKPGQVVQRGQLLGWVGATGCTSGGFGHMHSGVFRLTNTNLHTASSSVAGYRVAFAPNDADTGTAFGSEMSIDPLGWANGNAFDPHALEARFQELPDQPGFIGSGGWSIDLFNTGEGFAYP